MEVLSTGEVAAVRDGRPPEEIVEEAARAQDNREQFDRSRLEMVRGYAELEKGCRRGFVLSYFGERFDPPCGSCDNCDAGRVDPDAAADQPFAVDSRVAHEKWGEGVVQRYEEDKMVVLFDDVGYKTLAVDTVTDRGLLRAV